MNYDEMPAGREMDALVAEKVMGLEVSRDHYGGPRHLVRTGAKWGYDVIEAYSTKISSAWEVVERIIALEKYRILINPEKGECQVDLYDEDYMGDLELSCGSDSFSAPTAPLAICRAALKAIGRGEE